MQLDVGKIYDGKVTGITKFGAFVEIDKETTGMVHISEVANAFVNEIKDHIQEGQTVKVKVLSVGDDGKISLSIKKAIDTPRPPRQSNYKRDDNITSQEPRRSSEKKASANSADAFEEMLNKFKQYSEEKMSDLKKNMDSKRRNSSRRSGSKY